VDLEYLRLNLSEKIWDSNTSACTQVYPQLVNLDMNPTFVNNESHDTKEVWGVKTLGWTALSRARRESWVSRDRG